MHIAQSTCTACIETTIYISPHCVITTSVVGRSRMQRTFSILRTTSIPSITLPNATYWPSRKGCALLVMKNWQPFVFGPELRRVSAGRTGRAGQPETYFAIERIPGASCFTKKFSSANLSEP